MSKRATDESSFSNSPSKRSRGVRGADTPLETMAAPHVLTDARRGKRPHCFMDLEDQQPREPCHPLPRDLSTTGKPPSDAWSPGSLQKPARANEKKRPRDDPVGTRVQDPGPEEPAEQDYNPEDYNSFQYWRIPLPELDMSLLDEATDQMLANPETKTPSDVVKSNLKILDVFQVDAVGLFRDDPYIVTNKL